MSDLYALSFRDPHGKNIDLASYRGKVMLLVNTATRCGLAGQFEELETLHREYAEKGLVVIGFPCDQFAGQEPESNETMVGVCKVNFGVTFQLSEKIEVNGRRTHPIFLHLKRNTRNLFGGRIKWNFTKFLVSRDGKEIRRYAPVVQPLTLRDQIEDLLKG